MNAEAIGGWAGLVWNALSAADVLGLKQLKKITKLKDKQVFAALGWLARTTMSGSRCGAVVVENAWPQGKRPSPYQSNRCVKILDLDATV